MSPQHDFVIDNSTGANVRADINSVLQAIASNNSGSSAPSTTYALQSFANTTDSMLQLRNAANNAFVNLRKFDGALPLPDGSAASPSLFFTSDTNTGLFRSGTDTLTFATAGAQRLTVDSGGRVGIGVTSPSSFDAEGDDLVVSTGSHTGITINSGSAGSTSRGSLYFAEGTSSDNDKTRGAIQYQHGDDFMRFITNTSECLRLDTSGNMGLGVTSISDARFRIKGANNSTSTFNDGLMITSNNETVYKKYSWAGIETSGGLTFNEASSGSVVETVRIDSSGKVGIGNTSPASFDDSADLLVVGTTSGNNGITIVGGSSNSSSIYFADGTSGGSQKNAGIVDYNHSTDTMRFATAADNAMVINSNRDISMGTTSVQDSATLTISNRSNNGIGLVTGINTTQNMITFRNDNGVIGSIKTNGSSTSFNTSSSDRTMKKNFELWSEKTLDLFRNINPQKFNFINEDDSKEKTKGFIAQDIVNSFPEAYPKDKDDKYVFNPSGMVVYLMKAIQELEAKVAALETA